MWLLLKGETPYAKMESTALQQRTAHLLFLILVLALLSSRGEHINHQLALFE
jgi:hypothetical protein